MERCELYSSYRYLTKKELEMLHRVMVVLKALYRRTIFFLDPITIGELVRSTGLPYSTVRRRLETAQNSELVDSEIRPYKSTGKRVFWLTEKGMDWVSYEMGQL